MEAAAAGRPHCCREAAVSPRLDPCAPTMHAHSPATDLGAGLLNGEVTTFRLSRRRCTNTRQERMTAAGSFQSINIVEQSVTVTEPDAVAMSKFLQQISICSAPTAHKQSFLYPARHGEGGTQKKMPHLGVKKIK